MKVYMPLNKEIKPNKYTISLGLKIFLFVQVFLQFSFFFLDYTYQRDFIRMWFHSNFIELNCLHKMIVFLKLLQGIEAKLGIFYYNNKRLL